MRFKEFLLREDSTYMTLEEGLEAVKTHCKQFLNDVKGTDRWLYRGMNIPVVDSVIRMDHMKERQPRDSSGGYNVFFNLGIELAYGIPMIRSKCVFTTGSRQDAKGYGNLYFAFPQGNYKYLWSPNISDSYISDMQLLERFAKILHDDTGVTLITARTAQEIFSTILQQSGENISRAVMNMKTNDQMIEEAFAEFEVDATAEQIDDAVKKSFVDMYQDEGIDEAIRAGNEIMVHESAGNIFIPAALLFDHLRTKGLEPDPEEFLTKYFWSPGA